MNTSKEKFEPPVQRHGWVNNLARLANCSRVTVRNAVYFGSPGVKAEKVRQLYRVLYGNKNSKSNERHENNE